MQNIKLEFGENGSQKISIATLTLVLMMTVMGKKFFNLPTLFCRGGFEPETLDAEKRTIVLRWSTGEKVLRGGFFTDPFYEELSLNSDSVRMSRLKNGAPLLNTHSNQNVLDQIGVVEDSWLENGSGYASVRFSERAKPA